MSRKITMILYQTFGNNTILAGAGNDTIVSKGRSILGYDHINGGSGDESL